MFTDLNSVHWDTKLVQTDFECFRVSLAKSLLSKQIETSSPRLHMNRTFCIWHWSTLWNLEEMSRLSFFRVLLLLSKFLPSSIGFYDLFRTLHCHPSCIVVTNNIYTKKKVIFIKKFSLFSTQIARYYEKEPKLSTETV